jgi:AbrB family looped-hinge helix DNA binding protein
MQPCSFLYLFRIYCIPTAGWSRSLDLRQKLIDPSALAAEVHRARIHHNLKRYKYIRVQAQRRPLRAASLANCQLLIAGCWFTFRPLLYFMVKCKAMTEATLSAKNQIVIPREAREALGLKPGDKILVIVRGEKVLVLQRPKSHRVAMRGMARGIYAADHVQKERRDWR